MTLATRVWNGLLSQRWDGRPWWLYHTWRTLDAVLAGINRTEPHWEHVQMVNSLEESSAKALRDADAPRGYPVRTACFATGPQVRSAGVRAVALLDSSVRFRQRAVLCHPSMQLEVVACTALLQTA